MAASRVLGARTRASVAGVAALVVASTAWSQALGRRIEAVDAVESDRHVNVTVQFNCSIRYMSHAPSDVGQVLTIRLRLGADCGSQLSGGTEQAPVGGATDFVRRATLEMTGLGDGELTLEWAKPLHFVLAPTTDGRGIRVRLLDALGARKAVMAVGDAPGSPSGYAVNLESRTEPFSDTDLQQARESLGVPVFVSTLELEGKVWYRLRAGPFAVEREAKKLLLTAQQTYPRAWLGIDDELQTAGEPSVVTGTAPNPTVPIDPVLPEAERHALMAQARTALARKNPAAAVTPLTRLTRQPEYPERARAQELLGLARERSGQLAHAKAEYEEYLRRYPSGDAAARIRTRLRALNMAARGGKRGTLDGGEAFDGSWRLTGGVAQTYRWERNQLDTPDASLDEQSQNALFSDGDVTARRRGERFDLTARVSAGYAKDLLPDGPGDQTRVSTAFIELNDRTLGLAGRLGRQSRSAGGLLGTFDGLLASYQIRKRVALHAAAGFPVESTRDGPQTARQFFGLSADFGPFRESWDLGAFMMMQSLDGETDRQALGFEGRYFVPGRTLVWLVDYDVFYGSLNSAVVMGNLLLPARWGLSLNAEHRRAPVLTTRNALIGQSVPTLDELLGMLSIEEVRQLAEDRTATTEAFSASLSRPVGARFHFSLDTFASKAAATPESGGVPATPATGFDRSAQVQLSGSSLWRSSDLWVLYGRVRRSDAESSESVGLSTRLPLAGAWRFGPRIRIDRRESTVDLARETLYVPALRIDYQRGGTWFEFEGGAELGSRRLPADEESSTRAFFGLGYRIAF